MTISALGYLGIGVKSLDDWLSYNDNVIGMEVTEKADDGTVYLRMDELHHRVSLHPNGADDITYVGLQTHNKEEFEETKRTLFEAGVEFSQGSDAEIQNRMVRDMVKFSASGVPLEVSYGPKVLYERPFQSPLRITGFKTGGLGLGHIGVNGDNNEELEHILINGLGLKVSDALGGHERFFHCAGDTSREHTFVLGRDGAFSTEGRRIQHFMVELNSLDDVGSGLDRVEDNGVVLSSRLGKHTNDHMVSFYMFTPSGFRLEYGWNGRTVDDANWNVQIYDKASVWGHRRTPEGEAAMARR